MDAWLQRLYEKYPVRYGVLVLAIAMVWGAVLAVLHDVYFGARLYGLSTSQFLVVLAVGESGLAIAAVAGFVRVRSGVRVLVSWLRAGSRSREMAGQLLQSLYALPRRFVIATAIVGTALGVVPGGYLVLQYGHGLTFNDSLVTFIAGVGPVMYTVTFIWFWLEYAVRRIITDASSWVPEAAAASPRTHVGLGAKLTLGLSASTVASAELVSAFAQRRGSRGTGMTHIVAWTAGASTVYLATVAVTVALMILVPVRNLIRGTNAVSTGDYDITVPVTTDDELGTLTSSFNTMVSGLRERRRLREDNEALVADLRASRARVVAAADAERKRVERNIHDGAQQRLVALGLDLRMLEDAALGMRPDEIATGLAGARGALSAALAELRELARGLHPSILTTDGLHAALRQLAVRCAVPVQVDAPTERFDDSVENAAYFVVAEGLVNVTKYAHASQTRVIVRHDGTHLSVEVTDDGIGGARFDPGGGLTGLHDRILALDGTLTVHSPLGAGTTLYARIPVASKVLSADGRPRPRPRPTASIQRS